MAIDSSHYGPTGLSDHPRVEECTTDPNLEVDRCTVYGDLVRPSPPLPNSFDRLNHRT
jgi:hypothetical protein